jgi:quercetin dioxygenase-like cupin family protein
LAVREVTMEPRQQAPEQSANREHVWTVLEGELSIRVDGARHTVREGMALRVPAEVSRQVSAVTCARALVATRTGCVVRTSAGDERPLTWTT